MILLLLLCTCLGQIQNPIDSVCEFMQGDGIGTSEMNTGKDLTRQDCAQYCLRIGGYNGATIRANGEPGCWCENGMTGSDGGSEYMTCFLTQESGPIYKSGSGYVHASASDANEECMTYGMELCSAGQLFNVVFNQGFEGLCFSGWISDEFKGVRAGWFTAEEGSCGNVFGWSSWSPETPGAHCCESTLESITPTTCGGFVCGTGFRLVGSAHNVYCTSSDGCDPETCCEEFTLPVFQRVGLYAYASADEAKRACQAVSIDYSLCSDSEITEMATSDVMAPNDMWATVEMQLGLCYAAWTDPDRSDSSKLVGWYNNYDGGDQKCGPEGWRSWHPVIDGVLKAGAYCCYSEAFTLALPTHLPTTDDPPTHMPSKWPTQLPTTDDPTHMPSKWPTQLPTTDDPTYVPSKRPTIDTPYDVFNGDGSAGMGAGGQGFIVSQHVFVPGGPAAADIYSKELRSIFMAAFIVPMSAVTTEYVGGNKFLVTTYSIEDESIVDDALEAVADEILHSSVLPAGTALAQSDTGSECVDDDGGFIIYADSKGFPASGCLDILGHCDSYEEEVVELCPFTCGEC